jgi:toxin ParE1/3/4
MSSGERRTYRLSPRARDDLEEIWRYTAEIWSVAQADAYINDLAQVFETTCDFPTLARLRTEFTPPVRIHPHESHLVVYEAAEAEIVVLRVLGGRQDWISILTAADH